MSHELYININIYIYINTLIMSIIKFNSKQNKGIYNHDIFLNLTALVTFLIINKYHTHHQVPGTLARTLHNISTYQNIKILTRSYKLFDAIVFIGLLAIFWRFAFHRCHEIWSWRPISYLVRINM